MTFTSRKRVSCKHGISEYIPLERQDLHTWGRNGSTAANGGHVQEPPSSASLKRLWEYGHSGSLCCPSLQGKMNKLFHHTNATWTRHWRSYLWLLVGIRNKVITCYCGWISPLRVWKAWAVLTWKVRKEHQDLGKRIAHLEETKSRKSNIKTQEVQEVELTTRLSLGHRK